MLAARRPIELSPLVVLAVVAVVWAAALSAWLLTRAPAVGYAAAIDLTATAGLAAWWLRAPRWMLGVIVGVGGLIAKLVVGSSMPVLLGMLEVGSLGWVAWRLSRAKSIPAPLADELTILRYAITGWRTPKRIDFTMHREAGWSLFAGVLVFLTIVETPVLHIIFVAVDLPVAAWIATGLSLYGAVWLIGDAHAIRHGGISVTAASVDIRLGVRVRGSIARADIVRVDREIPAGAVRATIMSTNVVVLHLAREVELRGLLGRKKRGTAVALTVDEPDRLMEALR